MSKTLQVSGADLGFGSIEAQSQNVDWDKVREANDYDTGVILPRLTYGEISDHTSGDFMTKAEEKIAQRDPDREAPRDLCDRFEQTDAHSEWRDGFEPMMNYVWPAFLPYKMDAQDLADRLAKYAPTMTLIHFGEHSDFCSEEYGYGLSGGGMNLSDQIAAAYLCANQIPPHELLSSLPGVIGPGMLERIGEPLRAAYEMAAEWAETRAQRLREDAARVFKGDPA